MIVVQRRDVEPGGRFAGGRFAPLVSLAVTEQEPSPHEMRERIHQRIQDEGYLRSRRSLNPQVVGARATADVFDALTGELQPVLAGSTPGGGDETGSSPSGGIIMSPERIALTGLGDALNQDGLSLAESLISGRPDVAVPIEVAGLPLWLVRLLRQVVRKPPAKPGPSKPSAPRPPGHEKPAPVVPPKPGSPLSRIPDLGVENSAPEMDSNQDEKTSNVQGSTPDDIQRTIRERVAEKFRQTTNGKVEIDLRELELYAPPKRVIREFTSLWLNGNLVDGDRPSATVQVDLTRVSPELAQEIQRKTGLDVSGFTHAIDTQGLSHAFGGHDEFNENRQGQVPINEESISSFLEIVSDPRNIHDSGVSKRGFPVIVFRKRVNGHYWFIESIQTGKKRLALFSHYIHHAKGE